MELLFIGLTLFIACHLIPSFPHLKQGFTSKTGPNVYKILFSLISIASLVLIVKGLMAAPFQDLYTPPTWGRHLNMLLMLPAIYLFLSNTALPAPSTAKTITAHPVNWSIIFWSTGHLLANGDVAHVALFSSLGIFSVISIITGNKRGAIPLKQRPPILAEAVTILITLIIYGALMWGHQYITGMPLIPS